MKYDLKFAKMISMGLIIACETLNKKNIFKFGFLNHIKRNNPSNNKLKKIILKRFRKSLPEYFNNHTYMTKIV